MHKSKGFCSILLSLCLIIQAFFPGIGLGAGVSFSDVSGHWAEEAIQELNSLGYVHGYGDNRFLPDKTMTRAEFITLLNFCAQTNPTDTQSSFFSDTPTNYWATPQINAAVNRGYLIPDEYPNGLTPNGEIKRSEAAALVIRALGKTAQTGALNFTDAAEIDRSMYKGYIKTAVDEKIMAGYPDGTFQPYASINRAQACLLMLLFMEHHEAQKDLSANTIKTLVVNGIQHDFSTTPIYLDLDGNEERIYQVHYADDQLTFNSHISQNLSFFSGDIRIGNQLYQVLEAEIEVENQELRLTETRCTLKTVDIEGYTYKTEFVDLFISGDSTAYSLSTLEILDAYTVFLNGNTYSLRTEELVLCIDEDTYYQIERVNLAEKTEEEVTFSLTKTHALSYTKPKLSNISAIIADAQALDLSSISSLNFIIGQKKYPLSTVTLNIDGTLTVNRNPYTASQVILLIGDSFYQLQNMQFVNQKFMFFCTEIKNQSWVILNDEYLDAEDVRIQINDFDYLLDQVLVIEKNLVRVGSRQYSLNSSNFYCSIGNIRYVLKTIDYETETGLTKLETTTSGFSSGQSQPQSYIFDLDGQIYSGALSKVRIKVSGYWQNFSQIQIYDPNYYTFNGTTYNLISATLFINDTEWEVTDTLWRGQAQELTLYLE